MDETERTRTAIQGVLTMDPTISPQQMADIDAILCGTKIAVKPQAADTQPPIRPRDAAKMLGVTPKDLLYHAKRGRIRRVCIPGSSRSLGYVAADIHAMLEGGTR